MNRPWFDPETGLLLLDAYVAELPSYREDSGRQHGDQ